MSRKKERDEFLEQVASDLSRRIAEWQTKYRKDDYAACADVISGTISHYGIRMLWSDKTGDEPTGIIEAYLVTDKRAEEAFGRVMGMRGAVAAAVIGTVRFEPGEGPRGRGWARSFVVVEGPRVDLRDQRSMDVARTWSVGALRDLMAATRSALG